MAVGCVYPNAAPVAKRVRSPGRCDSASFPLLILITAMAPLRILSERDVDSVIASIGVQDIISNQAIAFAAFFLSKASQGQNSDGHGQSSQDPNAVQNPSRLSIVTRLHTMLIMPARVSGKTSLKIVGVPKPQIDAPAGLPATVLITDESTGRTKAIVNAGALTGLRTAGGAHSSELRKCRLRSSFVKVQD